MSQARAPWATTTELNVTLQRTTRRALLVAVVAGAATAYGYSTDRAEFYPAYLTALMHWLGMALGCLGTSMLHGLSGGGWGRTIRRVLEAGYQTLPLLTLLFLPIWLNAAHIYEWADPEVVAHHRSLQLKAGYLNIAGYQARAAICFAVWIGAGFFLTRFTPLGDTRPHSPRSRKLQRVSGLGLIGYGLAITVAAVDWVMSLEPEWFSTMYGVLYLAGQAVSGMSFALIVVALLERYEPWGRSLLPSRCNDLGNLLLAFVMFWAYVSFMQYLIIWSANLPEENVWYLHRETGDWRAVVAALMILHFGAPFLMLLSRERKQSARGLLPVAVLLLVMRYIDLTWLIVPGFTHGHGHESVTGISWQSVTAWLAIGGAWTAMFCWRLSARAQIPIYDPEAREAADERAH